MTVCAPKDVGELAEAVASGGPFAVVGTGSRCVWDAEKEGQVLSLRGLAGIVDFRPDDLVVTVRAGTLERDLDDAVREAGLCLPLADGVGPVLGSAPGTVGGLLGAGLPHVLEGFHGSVRDWCLGMKVVLGDGSVCSVGSQVAKSVAGYDIHRALVGSRGGLAVIAEVTLRLVSVKAVRVPVVETVGEVSGSVWAVRCLASEFDRVLRLAREGCGLLAWDRASWTIWCRTTPPFVEGLCWAVGPGGRRVRDSGALVGRLERNMKKVIDPGSVFCEGWLL